MRKQLKFDLYFNEIALSPKVFVVSPTVDINQLESKHKCIKT